MTAPPSLVSAGAEPRECVAPHPLFMGIPKARVTCCAIRRHPQIGFRCFMSTTAAKTSSLGPLGPRFIGSLDEKSRRYFRRISAR
jgi:hypothetical protein